MGHIRLSAALLKPLRDRSEVLTAHPTAQQQEEAGQHDDEDGQVTRGESGECDPQQDNTSTDTFGDRIHDRVDKRLGLTPRQRRHRDEEHLEWRTVCGLAQRTVSASDERDQDQAGCEEHANRAEKQE